MVCAWSYCSMLCRQMSLGGLLFSQERQKRSGSWGEARWMGDRLWWGKKKLVYQKFPYNLFWLCFPSTSSSRLLYISLTTWLHVYPLSVSLCLQNQNNMKINEKLIPQENKISNLIKKTNQSITPPSFPPLMDGVLFVLLVLSDFSWVWTSYCWVPLCKTCFCVLSNSHTIQSSLETCYITLLRRNSNSWTVYVALTLNTSQEQHLPTSMNYNFFSY